MNDKNLSQSRRARNLLRNTDIVDRLCGVMARWWERWSLTEIGREYGVSRQRVAVLLASVGCTGEAADRPRHGRPESRRRALNRDVAAAREALLHPKARFLTVRQRAALAWRAQGLIVVEIARRMDASPQGVRQFIVSAQMRLVRLSKPKARRRAGKPRVPRGPAGARIQAESIDPIDWSGVARAAERHRSRHVGPRAYRVAEAEPGYGGFSRSRRGRTSAALPPWSRRKRGQRGDRLDASAAPTRRGRTWRDGCERGAAVADRRVRLGWPKARNLA